MRWKTLLMFVGVACFLIGFGTAVLTVEILEGSEKTIYEKLREAEMFTWHHSDWGASKLKVAEYIQQFSNFEQFSYTYEEKHTPDAYVYLYVDDSWKVVWMEEVDFNTTSLVYVGFYFYSEPD